jgi:hypothetical protein
MQIQAHKTDRTGVLSLKCPQLMDLAVSHFRGPLQFPRCTRLQVNVLSVTSPFLSPALCHQPFWDEGKVTEDISKTERKGSPCAWDVHDRTTINVIWGISTVSTTLCLL